jgi:uncharacterized lipoprotein YajG
MGRTHLTYRICLLAAALALASCSSGDEPAATAGVKPVPGVNAAAIYRNAKIYTLDADDRWVEAMAIDGGKIVALGSQTDVMATARPSMICMARWLCRGSTIPIYIRPKPAFRKPWNVVF